jgi:AraC-like DNA-binding protein
MLFQVNTQGVAAADRAEYWREAMGLVLKANCHVQPLTAGPFEAAAGVMACGPLGLVELSGTAYRSRREGDGEPGEVSVMFQLRGEAVVSQAERNALLTPGDMCVVPPNGDILCERHSDFHQVIVNLPREQLDESVPAWRERTAVTVDRSQRGVRPALDLVRFGLAHRGTLYEEDVSEHLCSILLNLLAHGIGDDADPQRASRSSRLAQYHRQRIERYIDDNLRNPELSVALIAHDLGLSPRYVHKLYASEPVQVMRLALAKRLRACQRDIARRGARPLSEIAYAWGFNSAAHFSRAYKQHYGICPSAA